MPKLPFALPLLLLFASVMPLAAQAPETVYPEIEIAFLGDQGLGSDAESVLALIYDEGADAVIHMGDFDYQGDPEAWNAQIDAFLGPDFPYFASVGNHDEEEFYDPGGYQDLLEARMTRLGIPWEGDLGVRSSFHFRDILVVLTAPGSYGNGDAVFAPYIRDVLAADDSVWSISAWHKNMRRMQVGGKSDETGWGVYEESRRGGAIIATAHEHSYSRTHLLADFRNQVVASVDQPLVLEADDPATPGDEGRSFAFVSGLGGQSVRNQERGGAWWASIYTSDQGARPGALFGIFNYGGDPNLARFTFKDVTGRIVDDFYVTSTLAPPPPALRIADVAVVEGDSGSSEALLGVTLSNPSGDLVTVDWATVDGVATAGADYEARSGRLTFSGGVTEQSVAVSVSGDGIEEGLESFFVELLAADGAIVVRPRGEVVILDDDAPPAPLLLEIETQGAGLVVSDPPGGLYPPGTQVWLTAVAAPGYLFAGWEGDLTGASNPASVLLDRDHHVVARFEALEPSLEQVASGGAEDADSVSTAAPLAPGPGDLHLAAIASKPHVAVTGVSGLGLDWSPVRAQCSGRGQTGVAIWQARGEPTAGGIVTASLEQAALNSVLAVSRFSGVGALDPGDAVSANSVGIGGACSGGSDGDAYAIEVDARSRHSLVYVAAAARDQDHLPGPGFVERAQLFAGNGGHVAGISVADAPVAAAGGVPVAGGFDADADWAVVALEIASATPYELGVLPSPGGRVLLDPPFGAYASGSTVALTAVADPGHRFAGWSGDLVGAENPATLLMDSEKSVGASFVRQVRVDLLAPAGGSIALDPPGGIYDVGSHVVLAALPEPRHRFTGWGGALGGAQNPATLVVDADATVAASFVRLFEIAVSPGPGGGVALDPPLGPYDDGSSVTFTALPDAQHRFGAWTGALAGAGNPATLVIEADEGVGASFVPQATIALEPALGGSVALDPPGGRYDVGTQVTLSATPEPRHRFTGWSGALSGVGNPTSLVVAADASVGAGFVAQSKLAVIPAPGGLVLLDPPGGLYDRGTLVTLTASPRDGQLFASWHGDLSGASNPESLVVDRDLEVSADFVAPPSLEETRGGRSSNASSVSTQAPLLAADDDLYLAVIASKPHVAVSGVSGLGLAWSPVRVQCAGRGQTGLAIWQARGQPAGDGVVTASLSSSVQAAVVAVSRYASAGALDAARAVSANSNGVAGACQGGDDDAAYAFGTNAATPGGLLLVATAMRNRDHLPGSGFEERLELHEGSGGGVAGLALADRRAAAPGPVPVAGSFSGSVDWAAIALEIPSATPSAFSSGRHRR